MNLTISGNDSLLRAARVFVSSGAAEEGREGEGDIVPTHYHETANCGSRVGSGSGGIA
jgi:hypothetical protein